jgi:FkbM family methyltransferase
MAFRNANRAPELARCVRHVKEYATVIPAFLGLTALTYPSSFHDKAGKKLTVYDFEDLTTLWAVWCADEYRIPANAKTVVDAGANIGAFSLFAMTTAPDARIFALEPFPSTFEKLETAISHNGAANKVACRQVALTDRRTTLFMDASPEIKSHSRQTENAPSQPDHIEVEGWSLEDLIRNDDLPSIDYLKVDIEGGEVPFFVGTSPQTLRHVAKIGVECHSQAGQDQVWAKIEGAGFRLDRISRGSRYKGSSTAEFVRV